MSLLHIKFVRILLFHLLLFLKIGNAQNLHWVKSIGGNDFDMSGSVQLDGIGNIYICGSFRDTVDFDPGQGLFNMTSMSAAPYDDIFILKLDPNGAFIWAKQISGCNGGDMHVDQTGNVFLTGFFNGFADLDPGPGSFVVNSYGGGYYLFANKLDSSGNFLWGTSIGAWGASCLGLNICSDAFSNIYLSGIYSHPSSFPNYVDFDPGPGNYLLSTNGHNDVFMLKLNSVGSFLWAKSFGGAFYDGVGPMQVRPNGEIILAGGFEAGCDLDPGPSSYFVSSVGQSNPFVSRFDSLGNFIWGRAFGDAVPASLMFDVSDNVYISGYFSGTSDFDPGPGSYTVNSNGGVDTYVLKLSPAGNFNWVRTIGGSGHEHNAYSRLDSEGNVYTTGSFSGSVDFDPGPGTNYQISSGWYDTYLLKLDSMGNFIHVKTLPGQDSSCASFPSTFELNPADEVFLTGILLKTVDFDPGYLNHNLSSNGAYDVFLLKLGACNFSLGRDSLIEVCKGESITLSTHKEAIYLWNPGSVNSNSLSFIADTTITYTLLGHLSPECSDTLNFVVQVNSCLGLANTNFISGEPLKVFPNPSKGEFQIQGDREMPIKLLDAMGHHLQSYNLKSEDLFYNSVLLTTPGVYFLVSPLGSQKLLILDR